MTGYMTHPIYMYIIILLQISDFDV